MSCNENESKTRESDIRHMHNNVCIHDVYVYILHSNASKFFKLIIMIVCCLFDIEISCEENAQRKRRSRFQIKYNQINKTVTNEYQKIKIK